MLAYYRNLATGNRDIWLYSLEGDGEPVPFRATPYNERSPSFSPDGRFIAYVSDESGRELFYRHGNQFMAVAVETKSGFHAGTPELMFEGGFLAEANPASGSQTYDVSLDGQRFLAVVPDRSSARIVVVVNWLQELERLLANAH